MDVSQFYATVAAVIFGNGVFLSFLYACWAFDQAKKEGREVPWKIIGLGFLMPAVGGLSAYFFVVNH